MMAKIQIILGFLLGLIVFTTFHYNAPVLVLMEAKNWEIEAEKVSAEIEGYKIRNCSIIEGSTAGYVIKGDMVTEVPVTFESKAKLKPSSIIYKIAFGKWTWHYDQENTNVPSVLVTMKYECGGTIINQAAGPFPISSE